MVAGLDGRIEQVFDGDVMVMVWLTESVQPALFFTTSVTVNVPAVAHACEVFCNAEVAASPKFHAQWVTPPEPESGMLRPTHAVGGSVNAADGGAGTLIVNDFVDVHPPSETVKVTTCDPGVKLTGGGVWPENVAGDPPPKDHCHEVIGFEGRWVE
jgi:hypothetical protein